MVSCSMDADGVIAKRLLWLYVPDWAKDGRMDSISEIKGLDGDVLWRETKECAGFEISPDCPWRVTEMELVKYTPIECLQNKEYHCDTLQAYARFQTQQ